MSKLDDSLAEWVSMKFINQDQAQLIRQHEVQKPSRSWIMYGFLLLGALTIGIGIISLIASNWEKVPDGFKLGLDFIVLLTLSWGAYQSWKKGQEIYFDVLLVAFMVMILASIGLISQIYHTGGHLYQALFLWSLITVGLAAAAKRSFAPLIWGIGFFSSMTLTLLNMDWFEKLYKDHWQAIFMAIPMFAAMITVLCRNLSGDSGQTRAVRWITVLAGLAGLNIAEYSSYAAKDFADYTIWPYLPAYVATCLCVWGIARSTEYKSTQKKLLTFATVLFLIPFHLAIFEIETRVPYAALNILTLMSMAMFFASLRHKRIFQIFLSLAGIRIIGLYFELLGSLAMTGFGLIFSGIVIIGLVSLWNKYRLKIGNWAEGVTQ